MLLLFLVQNYNDNCANTMYSGVKKCFLEGGGGILFMGFMLCMGFMGGIKKQSEMRAFQTAEL